jgi:hypothetical protein
VLIMECTDAERSAMEEMFSTGARCLLAVLFDKGLLNPSAVLAAYSQSA